MNDMMDSRGSPPFKGFKDFTYSWWETDIEEMKFGYIWTIKKFSRLQEAYGECIDSSTFSASESGHTSKWYLQLYPRGNHNKNGAYVSLHLRHESDSLEVPVSTTFELSVLNHKGEKIRIQKSDMHVFTKEQSKWGFEPFIEREYLMSESNGLLPNDELTLCCEIVILAKPKNTNRHYNTMVEIGKEQGCSRLLEDLGHLLKSENYSDVVLVAEDKELHAHKTIIGARSQVFHAMFQHDMKETRLNRVVISDIGFEVLEKLVRFIYTGQLAAFENEEQLMQLLIAADKYALEDLKVICVQTFCNKLTAENVVKLIPVASLQNCDHLKARIIDLMKRRATDEAVDKIWNLIIQEHPQFIAGAFKAKPEPTPISFNPGQTARHVMRRL